MFRVPPFEVPTQEQRAKVLDSYGLCERLIREKERKQITSVSTATWWRLEQQNKTPPKKYLGRAVAWLLSDLLIWVSQI
ncbi:AlpA family phage regulatory protein [Shewanella sp. 202IG2-18]|uniref:helix-turn-helix transcriptional regulator n=1 Tax=Parashewanella hymeniacidonis TaxID=2807618 RepID=UPI00196194CE|nr:AlpA family phage regulatory protein [Parashewanella hymeniacidonis]MBM7073010.1 AlpA family phage regulatory protein [Parashewanella hymeniacidonis]